jgi:hypothetical protein
MRTPAILVLLGASAAAHAGEACDATLDTLLDRYVEARGGFDALERQTALRLRSTNHEGRWNPVFDYRTMKPGYMWISATYDDGEVIFEGFDGERGWEKWGDKPAEYVGGDAARGLNQGAQSPVHLYGLHHMEDLGSEVTFEGCTDIDGDTYFNIRVISAFGTDIDYFLDGDYRLVRGRSVRPLHPTIDPTPITIEERWSEFRLVGDVLHPFAYSQ